MLSSSSSSNDLAALPNLEPIPSVFAGSQLPPLAPQQQQQQRSQQLQQQPGPLFMPTRPGPPAGSNPTAGFGVLGSSAPFGGKTLGPSSRAAPSIGAAAVPPHVASNDSSSLLLAAAAAAASADGPAHMSDTEANDGEVDEGDRDEEGDEEDAEDDGESSAAAAPARSRPVRSTAGKKRGGSFDSVVK